MAKSSTSFKKGEGGRPKGAKNRNAMRPVHWWNWFEDAVKDMDEKRLPYIKWAIEQMMPKVPVIPATMEDSAQNGAKAWELMNGIAPVMPPVESNPSANGGHANGNG